MAMSLIDFSKAKPLKHVYEFDLLEDYDYEYSPDFSLFDKIKSHFDVLKVKKVNNPQIYGMYLLSKEELQNDITYVANDIREKTLYHTTSAKKALSIARNNFDWRKNLRSRYGVGVCFSPDPVYSDKYASSHGVMLICKVLTKKVQAGGWYGKKVPRNKKCDTTSGSKRKVFVKYDDNSFYPEYMVYYSQKTLHLNDLDLIAHL